MSRYYKNLPRVEYTLPYDGVPESVELTSINTKVSFSDLTIQTADNFYPYVMEDGDRVDTIADFYYNDSYRFWLVLLSNQASDLYYDFALQSNTFERYIIKKYKDAAAAASYDVTVDTNVIQYTKDTIKHYLDADGDIIDQTTYNTLSPLNRSTKNIYDWETDQNESKREIQLVSSEYTGKIERQFKDLMKRKR